MYKNNIKGLTAKPMNNNNRWEILFDNLKRKKRKSKYSLTLRKEKLDKYS